MNRMPDIFLFGVAAGLFAGYILGWDLLLTIATAITIGALWDYTT